MASLRHSEAGMTLVELLIAMTLMAIGIAAIVAGFSSGIFALGRADQTSVAATLADQQMEIFRQFSYSSIPVAANQAPSTLTTLDSGNCNTTTFICPGTDNRKYWLSTTVIMQCPDGSTPSGGSCTSGEPVKLATVTVKDASNSSTCPGGTTCSGKTLITESSTFDSLTG
jgi:prepilin-type N-terminal cleavage/methylation domain-containing protein